MDFVCTYYDGFQNTSNTNNYHQFSTYECPIIVKGKTITLNSKTMAPNFPYYFEYQGMKMMAIKKSDTTIEIYEILGR